MFLLILCNFVTYWFDLIAYCNLTLFMSNSTFSLTCADNGSVNVYVQGVPGVKVTSSGFNSRADSESETSYTHGSNWQRFKSYGFLKFLKIRKERAALCIYWAVLLKVQLQIRPSTIKKLFEVSSVCLDAFSHSCDQRTCNPTKHCSVVDASCSTENPLE